MALGLVGHAEALAASTRSGFESGTLEGALLALGGRPAVSDQVRLSVLDVAEDGTAVPVGVLSLLPDTTEIHVLVEKNPVPLAASFRVLPGTAAQVQLRVKMADTSDVLAVVRAGGVLYLARQQTTVTLGSCGN